MRRATTTRSPVAWQPGDSGLLIKLRAKDIRQVAAANHTAPPSNRIDCYTSRRNPRFPSRRRAVIAAHGGAGNRLSVLPTIISYQSGSEHRGDGSSVPTRDISLRGFDYHCNPTSPEAFTTRRIKLGNGPAEFISANGNAIAVAALAVERGTPWPVRRGKFRAAETL